ncbi:MAG: hypothetical protein AMQ74_01753 [Candidatus Methanofastidiosum methylothiophilum]|uniref:Bacterial bifunctional deaminase-reductase C-terminal domain-containing protein n=1 Tax=Candidatus Methanofastidiosum methylothiophilum TaxID=1705564 RepID=A0A150IPP2_9EURY|nr:MAG: hypothetical protein AMQ74_01753 [Candidatus Methanofastidiosum methylthiophilus]
MNLVFIATSLDGFIAKDDRSIDWLTQYPNQKNENYGYDEFVNRIDAVVMGRITFETVLTFNEWPYSKHVFVLSTKLKKPPTQLDEKVTVLNCTPKEVIIEAKERNYKTLYIDGGKTIQNFLKDDLIDEMIITRIPIILGSGIPLFSNIEKSMEYEHKETKVFSNGFVKSHYLRIRHEE